MTEDTKVRELLLLFSQTNEKTSVSGDSDKFTLDKSHSNLQDLLIALAPFTEKWYDIEAKN